MADCRVTLAGVTMNSDVPDGDSVLWSAGDVDGWDSPLVRADDEDRTGQHGGYGSARLYGSRVLTLPGAVECPSLAAAFAVRSRLHAIAGMDGPVELVVHEPVPKRLMVEAGGPPRSSTPIDAAPFLVNFQIPLVAHDPFKRVLTSTTTPLAASSSVTVPQAGTAPAALRVTVTTAGTVVLSAGGATLTTTSLPVGAVVTCGPGFDSPRRTVRTSGGTPLLGVVLPGSQWPSLPAGGGPVTQAGTAALSVEHFDTYA